MTLHVTTPDVTRYHSYGSLTDRTDWISMWWIRYEFSKKLYTFWHRRQWRQHRGTFRFFESVDGTCLDKSLVHNSGQPCNTNILWLTRFLEGLNSEGINDDQKEDAISCRYFWYMIIVESISFANISLLTVQILLKLNFETLVIFIQDFSSHFDILVISIFYLAENVSDKNCN